MGMVLTELQSDIYFCEAVPTEQRAAYASSLLECCSVGRRLEGANRAAQLSFFRTSDDVEGRNNELDVVIEQAILSDCERTMDAIQHAVLWGDPLYTGVQSLACRLQQAQVCSKSPSLLATLPCLLTPRVRHPHI